jgi:hypothetical protein
MILNLYYNNDHFLKEHLNMFVPDKNIHAVISFTPNLPIDMIAVLLLIFDMNRYRSPMARRLVATGV